MIVVKLQGGLGNQLFQYAFGRNLSLLHRVPLKIDSSYLRMPNQSSRTYLLDAFAVEAPEATQAEIARYRSPIQKILDKVRPAASRRKIIEPAVFDPKIMARSDGYFDGHWQDERYFAENAETIRREITLKNKFGNAAQKASDLISSYGNSVSVHIRRGDYVSIQKIADVHGALPLSYYEQALQAMSAAFPDAHFFVSSDDIEWAKQHFPQKDGITFLSSPSLSIPEEFMLMSQCSHAIVANSTFSAWAAWLNENPGKKVIAPAHWFKDASRSRPPFIPSSWQTI